MDHLVHARELSKTIAGKDLFQDANFEVNPYDCIGFIGPNGSGKTTLFKMLLGIERPSLGELRLKEGLRLRYLEQTAVRDKKMSVLDFFNQITSPESVNKELVALEARLGDPNIYETGEYEEILEKIKELSKFTGKGQGVSHREEAAGILAEVGMGEISPKALVNTLSGGERQKLALASILSKPDQCDLLLLDEPTNHLDIETIEWLERELVDFPGAVFMVSHDRYLLDDLVERVFDIQGNELVVFDASYQEYVEQNEMRQHVARQSLKRQKIEARRHKAIIQKLSRRNKYDSQIASKIKRFEKKQKTENSVFRDYFLRFHFKEVFKSGKNVADGEGIFKSFEGKKILEDAKFEITSGQRIGLIGPNGCGKTTFLRMLTGEEKADDGNVYVSKGVKLGYFDQGHLSLKYKNTLLEEILRTQDALKEEDAKGLLGQFNFRGHVIHNRVEQLSGGERARLAFLRMIMQPFNFLILDEPTNHLDITSRSAIETALNSYKGTVLVVSHDRHFLDASCDTIFHMNNARLTEYTGNYTIFRQTFLRNLELADWRERRRLSNIKPEKYKVFSGFTEWTTRTKYKVGDLILINENNELLFQAEIENGSLRPVKK